MISNEESLMIFDELAYSRLSGTCPFIAHLDRSSGLVSGLQRMLSYLNHNQKHTSDENYFLSNHVNYRSYFLWSIYSIRYGHR